MVVEFIAVGIDKNFKLCLFFIKNQRDIFRLSAAEVKYASVGHGALVHKEHVGGHTQLAADLRKGIDVILQAVGKLLADFADIAFNAGVFEIAINRIGVNEHGDAVFEARVVSAVVHGGENGVLSAAVFA